MPEDAAREVRIDRLAPTRRPARRLAGHQTWRDLLFVHWEVPVEAVREKLPDGLEPDLFEGRMLVGLVPFRMNDVRPWWLPRPFAFNFLETNLRTYVTCKGEPGVYFFSLDAASWLAVKAARLGWGLPYFHANMSVLCEPGDAWARTLSRPPDTRFEYESRRRDGVGLEARWTVGEALGSSEPGSLEFFLLERYLLFVERKGTILRGQVHHAPYPAHAAHLDALSTDLGQAAGLPAFGEPACVHFSPGVEVEIFALEAIA